MNRIPDIIISLGESNDINFKHNAQNEFAVDHTVIFGETLCLPINCLIHAQPSQIGSLRMNRTR